MRIVADTNLLIASIFWNGAPYKIIQQALEKKIELVTSQEILKEVQKVLSDPKEGFILGEQEINDILKVILQYALLVQGQEKVNIVRDPKDNHILSCALAAKAEYIVTRDKDILILKVFNNIKIITPEEFLILLNKN